MAVKVTEFSKSARPKTVLETKKDKFFQLASSRTNLPFFSHPIEPMFMLPARIAFAA
jgi:hypothetical protein